MPSTVLHYLVVEPTPLGLTLTKQARRRKRRLAHSLDGHLIAVVVVGLLAFGLGMLSACLVWQPGAGYVRTDTAVTEYMKER